MIFPDQQELTVQPEPLPAGQFLLPVCLTSQQLNDLLTAAWYGRYLVRKELDEGGEEFHSINVLMPLLEAMAFANSPYLAACWVGDVMGLVRYENCQLEQFNLITQEWEEVEGASFLPLDLTCRLTGHDLQLRPETNQPGLWLRAIAPKTNQVYLGVYRDQGSPMFELREPGSLAIQRWDGIPNGQSFVFGLAARHATPANNFGGQFTFQAAREGVALATVGAMNFSWPVVGAAGAQPQSRIYFNVNDAAGVSTIFDMRSQNGARSLGFFGVTPVVRPTTTGSTVPVALSSIIAAMTALGLTLNTTDFLVNAQNLIRLENCQLDQFNPVTSAWEPVGSVVPTTITPACNELTLDDTDWTIRRVDGSTEAANAVLRLRTERGTQSEALPMMMTFEQQQANDDMDTLAIVDVRNMAEDSPRYALSLFNGTGHDDLMELRNGPAGRRMGFFGAIPAQQQLIIADESFEQTLTRIALGLEQLGLFRIEPCFATFGDWGIKYTGEALTDLATCGVVSGSVVELEDDCPVSGARTATVITPDSSNAFNLVHVFVRFSITNVVPSEGVNWDIGVNAGGSPTNLDGANINALGTYERAWNGSVSANDVFFSVSDAGDDAAVQIIELRIEGTGSLPDDIGGGDECA